jgi:DNA polymerase-3 subunit delta'
MSWNSIINQKRVVAALRRGVAHDRVAHAYLFHGPLGTGKRAVALEFAKALECESGNEVACDRCLACTKVRKLVHPDVQVILPQPKDVLEEEVARRLKLLADEPYAETDFTRRPSLEDPAESSNKQAIYTVNRIRELRRMLSYTPSEGRYKVTIMADVDRMRPEASNTFLKLLEEPTPRTVLILTTHRPDQLLPTVASRCQQVRFNSISPGEIREALQEREDVAEDEATMVAHMANGSYTRALELLNNDELQQARELALQFFRQSYLMDVDTVLDLATEISNRSREQVKGLLDLMLTWTRDLLLYRTTADDQFLVNVDQHGAIHNFVERVPEANIREMTEILQDAVSLVERNVHLELMMITLAQQLHHLMHGRGKRNTLYEPLA